jgi:hypothetical protein
MNSIFKDCQFLFKHVIKHFTQPRAKRLRTENSLLVKNKGVCWRRRNKNRKGGMANALTDVLLALILHLIWRDLVGECERPDCRPNCLSQHNPTVAATAVVPPSYRLMGPSSSSPHHFTSFGTTYRQSL